MLYVCVRRVIDVVFSVCIVTCGAVVLVYGKYECFVVQMLYVCVLCAYGGSSQCCILHALNFVNAGEGCKRRPNGKGILQSRSHECLLLFTPCCCGECFYHF